MPQELLRSAARIPAEHSFTNAAGPADCTDADGEEQDDEVSPLTFPEDTPHIPYKFTEISEVGF